MTAPVASADQPPALIINHWLLVVLLSCLSAMAPFSIDMYLPALPTIAEDFGVSSQRIQLTLSVFLVGFACGQLFYGVLSDRLGRRPLLLAGISLYLVASVCCALSQSAEQLLICRFFQALGGAVGILGVAMIKDVYPDSVKVSEVMSQIMMVMAVAPMIAPLLGGYFLLVFDWPAIFWFMVVFSTLLLVVIYRFLGETRPGKPQTGSLLSPFGRCLRQPATWAYVLAGGGAVAGMFAYITASPFVYIQYFGVSEQLYGWLFGMNVLGIMIGSYLNQRLVKHHGTATMLAVAVYLALVGAAGMVIGWWWWPQSLLALIVPLFFFLMTVGFASANAAARLFEYFPDDTGTIGALFGALRFLMGAAAGLMVSLLEQGDSRAMVWVIAGCGVLTWLGLSWTKRLEKATEE